MPYIVSPLAANVRQISLDDILDNKVDVEAVVRSRNRATRGSTATKTSYYSDDVPIEHYRDLPLREMVDAVRDWNNRYETLFLADRSDLYTRFSIPKSSGGWRRIDEPNNELKSALGELKNIFESIYKPLYHTSAFAYIPKRQTLDVVKKHQQNGSWWFLKTDFSNFFGSSTEEFVWRMLTQIFPFSEVVKSAQGSRELRKALSLCFLDGGLPQGTPISPFLTNVFMIPIDYRFANDFRNNRGDKWGGNHFVYTRYADDIHISCKGSFDWREITDYMRGVLSEFGAPYQLKDEKTHYGSRNGRNWILGVMLNKDNQITIGHKKKKDFRAMIHNYALARRGEGDPWLLEDIQYVQGLVSYYKEVEPTYINKEIEKFRQKNGYDFVEAMKEDVARGGIICFNQAIA